MFNGLNLKNEERIVFKLRSLYQKYGYAQYKMSKFEEYELYVRNKDFLVSDSIITFTDTNGKLLALKPDVTLSIVKNTADEPGCVQKVCYDENVYRISKSTRDFREIMQTGLECIGDIDAYNKYEVITLAAKSLEAVSESYVLDLSHIGIVSAALESTDCDNSLKNDILTCLGEKNLSGIEKLCAQGGIDGEARERLVTLVSVYGSIDKVLPRLKSICGTAALREAYDEFAEICNMLCSGGYSDRINIDFSIANDMKYYNGFVFRGFVEGVPEGVLSGGQYDNLMKKMHRRSGAIGFAVYLDRFERLGAAGSKYDVDTLLIYDGECRADDVAAAVEKLGEGSASVMAQKEIPQNIKYRLLARLDGEGVKIVEKND